MEILNFDNCKISGLNYGGHSGGKKGIIYNSEKWFLKYPKSTKSMNNVNLSYTTTPLSEYLGSHIYNMLGIDVHETMLGVSQGKLVVACKDFLQSNERIEDYTMIKNYEDIEILDKLDKLSSSTIKFKNDIDELKIIFKNNPFVSNNNVLQNRFWDMFVVDALIGNTDRNEGNWGIIVNVDTLDTRVCPVFDNGAAFYNKHDDNKMLDLLEDEGKFKNSAYYSSICAFSKDGQNINPLKYIEKLEDDDCNEALRRIVPKINLNKIFNLIDDIPENIDGIEVFSKTRKDFYKEVLQYRYECVLMPTLDRLLAREEDAGNSDKSNDAYEL